MFLSIICYRNGLDTRLFPDSYTPDYYSASNQYVSIQLKKRAAFPVTYWERRTDGTILCGYGRQAALSSDEFLHCTISGQGKLTIRRDAMATLPLFYAVLDGGVIVSNDYFAIAHQLSYRTLLLDALRATLSGEYFVSPLKEIGVLSAQQTLHFDGELHITDNNMFLRRSKDAVPTDPAQFRQIFSNYLDYFVASRLQGPRVAFEVSGGLDSALLPQYIASRYGHRPRFATAFLHHGEAYKSQQYKVNTLAQKLNAIVYAAQLNTKTNFPLSRMILSGKFYPIYAENPYHEVMQELLDQLHTAGTDVICTGHGGDEFFGNYVASDLLFQGIAYSAQVVKLVNNAYIEHGIWPVSPFMDPAMFAWVQGLPVQFRHDRAIMRAFHKAHSFVEDIYNPTTHEDFGSYILDCLTSGQYDTLIQHLTSDSAIQKLGLAHAATYKHKYEHLKTISYSQVDLEDEASAIYSWIVAEINARYISHTSVQ